MIKLYATFFATKTLKHQIPQKFSVLFLCFSVLVAISSCNKPDDPKITEPEPVFYITGTLNNAALELNAGQNRYYMYSSYMLDSNDVFSFSGEFKQTDCSACINTLKISFNNYTADAVPSSAIDAASFPISYLPFSVPGGTPAVYSVKFVPLTAGGQPQSYLWDFGDGTTSTDPSPTHIYATPSIYEVGLTVNYQSGCSSNITNPLNCGVTSQSCDAGFILSSVDTTTVMLNATPGGVGPYVFDWDFGDGSPHNNTQAPTHTFATQGVYQVCLTATSSDSCTTTRCLNVSTENPGTCSIRYSSVVTTIANPFNLSNAVVEWTDASGNHYTSTNASQPSSSFFKINSVEDYANNENGEKTKKLNMSINCVLYNGTNTINLTNAEAVVAVAYP